MESNSPQTAATTKRFFTIARLRHCLLILVGLATLIAIFYAEENWRGKRAWEQCKRGYEAQGYVMDWNALIPPPIPDDQNFYKAPKMSEWMVGRHSELFPLVPWPQARTNSLLAIIQVVVPGAAHAQAKDATVAFRDQTAATTAAKFLHNIVGPTTLSARDFTYVTRLPGSPLAPVLFVESASPLDRQAIAGLFGNKSFCSPSYGKADGSAAFRIESAGTNSFHLFANNVVTRDDYLALVANSDKYLNYVREALRRPYARPDGNYEIPYEIPIPNFVSCRLIVQLLNDRAKLDLSDGKTDDALEQLTLMHKLCRVLEGHPTSRPMTLVAAMINVAIQGLYNDVVAEGLRSHAWRETQLQELQTQLKEVNLLAFVESALEGERISMSRTLQSPRVEIAKLFSPMIRPASQTLLETNSWKRWRDPVFASIRLAPRGWFYQNMVSIADAMQPVIGALDLAQSRISPRQTGRAAVHSDELLKHPNPYNVVACVAIPNYARACQVLSKNQTYANLTYIACALERYHLAHNAYPETLNALNALVPEYADHIPHDIINGQPLHYHRTDDGQFKLYSVGWNEKDDGGVPGNDTTGDWVWQYLLQ